ncbi:DUF2860 family protein [Photobacterium satsumensis]|uniref:DUF2860 family protein n=1 Tax=Photobacterium satsumensis TaxID=2910239 RepID=UPI003D0C0BA5
MKQLFLGCILLCIPHTALAFNKSNFSGELSINTGVSLNNSNLNTNGSNQLTSLGRHSSYDDNTFFVPLGSLRYTLDDSQEQAIYMGTSRDDLAVGTLAFEIGYHRRLYQGTKLDVAYLPSVVSGEVWEDPYSLSKRKETDVEGNAYRFKLSQIRGSNFSFDFGIAHSEVKNEDIQHTELHRDYDAYSYKGQYLTMLRPFTGLISSFTYTDKDAKGDAASFQQYKLEASVFSHLNNHNIALTSSFSHRSYGAESPIFNKKRKDQFYRLTLAYEYTNIPGWKDWSITSYSYFQLGQSNINFYDENEYIFLLGLNYKL